MLKLYSPMLVTLRENLTYLMESQFLKLSRMEFTPCGNIMLSSLGQSLNTLYKSLTPDASVTVTRLGHPQKLFSPRVLMLWGKMTV